MYALYWTSQVALVIKNLPANAGDVRDAGSIPELERFPGGGHGNPLQYSCLKNPVDRGAWWATIHRVAKSCIRLQWLGAHIHPLLCCSTFFSTHSCLRSFIVKGCWVLLNMFSEPVAMATLFLSFILLMWSHTYWFESVEPSLQLRLEFHLFMVDVSFNVLLNSNLLIFFENFYIYINHSYWSVVFFSCSVLVWIWYQGNACLIEWVCEYFLFSFLKELEKEWY